MAPSAPFLRTLLCSRTVTNKFSLQKNPRVKLSRSRHFARLRDSYLVLEFRSIARDTFKTEQFYDLYRGEWHLATYYFKYSWLYDITSCNMQSHMWCEWYRERSRSSKVSKIKTVWHILLKIGVAMTYVSTWFIWIARFYFTIIFKNYLNASLRKFTFVKHRFSTWHFLVDPRTFIDTTQFIKYVSSNVAL